MASHSSDAAVAQPRTEATSPDEERCRQEQVSDPTIIVIFGATGDLAARKLFPALAALQRNRLLPGDYCILGVGRSKLSEDAFRDVLRQSIRDAADQSPKNLESMTSRTFYHQLDSYEDETSYVRLKTRLERLDADWSTRGNRLFYLAVPPSTYKTIACRLGDAGMARQDVDRGNWVRFVVEKPFGRDLESARDLDRGLHAHFDEEQIFRIDHYLAKETVQNILLFRLANAIFEPVWNRGYIESVTILAAEQLGVEHRAGYYDQFGVLRDMFQNHMMQLLALCAMEPPSVLEAERIRDEKTKVYRSLRPLPVRNLHEHLVLGQYAAGRIDGLNVPGYRDESGVADNSSTPTFAAMKLFVNNWRWQGVPFYLISGKRLAAKRTQIVVRFREVPESLFQNIHDLRLTPNRLILGIQPREEIALGFQAKIPGPRICLRNVRMYFDYGEEQEGVSMEAYEKSLLDCLLGDHTLFWRQDGVELCWRFLTPLLEECDCPGHGPRLQTYPAGSWGPDSVEQMLPDPLDPNR